jgi:hypothetical protein
MARNTFEYHFDGVPDDMLRTIGTIVVLAARLDFLRMRLWEVMTSVPVGTSAKLGRDDLTQEIRTVVGTAPFDVLADRTNAWLREADDLFHIRDNLSHSIGGFETRGDGRQRYVLHHLRSGSVRTQYTAATLNRVVRRLR